MIGNQNQHSYLILMKKLITLSVLAVLSTATMTTLGQGYLSLQSDRSHVWDGFTHLGIFTPTNTGTMNAALLWAPANTTPTVDSITISTPTTFGPVYDAYDNSEAWSDILNGQFTVAEDVFDDSLVIAPVTTKGAINYLGGNSFGVVGTTPNTTYTFYEIAWSSAYSTLAAAAAADAPLGWGAPIQVEALTPVNPNVPEVSSTPFGVYGVPEPGTMTLAGLGALSLLAFRKRKN